MTPTDEQLAFTVRHEGKVLDSHGLHRSYKDVLGNWTNGYGHLLSGPVDPISEERAQQQLREDLSVAMEHALLLCPGLDAFPGPFAALTDLVFNVGYDKILKTGHNTVAAFKAHNWPLAVTLFLKWDNGEDKKTGLRVHLPELKRRREEAATWIHA